MKTLSKIGLTICCLLICGCVSTGRINFDKITFTEISYDDYKRSDKYELYKKSKGYKIVGRGISNLFPVSKEGDTYYFEEQKLSKDFASKVDYYFLDRYYKAIKPQIFNSTKEHDLYYNDSIINKYEKNIVFYVALEFDFLSYMINEYICAIEGLPSVAEVDAEYEKLKNFEIEKKSKLEREKQEKIENNNNQGKKIAKGYIYHGIDEIERSNRLFVSEALTEGHAYYISGFTMNKYAPSNSAYIWRSIFLKSSEPVIVEYKNQLVKSEVVDSSYLLGDYLPIDVVVAGGRIPVVLGVIK